MPFQPLPGTVGIQCFSNPADAFRLKLMPIAA